MKSKYVLPFLMVFLVLSIIESSLCNKIAYAAAQPCAESLDKCPENGCAAEGTPDAISNQLKRHLVDVENAKKVTFIIMQKLQTAADDLVGQNHFLSQEDRDLLRDMEINGKKYSEGDAVRLAGYIVGKSHANKGESVNCRLTGVKNNDFHITIAETAGPEEDDSGEEGGKATTDLEFQGIVVEMIPQHRLEHWTIKKLEQVRTEKKKVLVVGQLFYDSKHKVNEDPGNPLAGQPKRMSLWEIHPVVKFYVCEKASGTCNDNTLADWKELR